MVVEPSVPEGTKCPQQFSEKKIVPKTLVAGSNVCAPADY